MAEEIIPFEDFKKGDEVFLKHINKWGVLLEVLQGKKRVRVACNAISLLVDVDNIGEGRRNLPKKRGRRVSVTVEKGCRIIEDCPTLDLHRMHLDEAIDRLGKFLDSAVLNGVHTVMVIHGHGSGRLKKGVREHLKESSYVASFRPASQDKGGDGVSVVELAEYT